MTTDKEIKSHWNVESLKEMVDQRFADNQKAVDTALLSQEKAVNAALLAAKEAVIKAEISTEKRFDTVTKSVTELSDQTGDLMPRTEYLANHKSLDDKIVVATDAINRSSGDKNLYATTSYVTQVVSQSIDALEVKIVAILTPLVDYVAAQKGVVRGTAMTKGNLYTAIGAAVAIIGVIFLLIDRLAL